MLTLKTTLMILPWCSLWQGEYLSKIFDWDAVT